jgi:predicted dehydrogenase
MSHAILIGYGSIGKRHLEELLKTFDNIHVLDAKFTCETQMDVRAGAHIQLFSDFSQIPRGHVYELAVIATWGPTHFEVAEQLIPFSPRFILLEKPVESSLQKVDALENLLNDNNIPAAVNFPHRYGTLMKEIKNILHSNVVGKICSVTLTGGAKCIATNGIHYLDFFMELFCEIPKNVFSNLTNDPINPRSQTLSYLGGMASFEFSSGRMLVLNFSNNSFADLSLEVIFERGRLLYRNSILKAWKVQESSIYENRPINRSLDFDKLFLDLDLNTSSQTDGISNLYSLIRDNPRDFSITDFTESSRQLIKALIAQTKVINLDSLTMYNENEYKKDWHIS